jgi:hypothetical protein
MPAIYDNGIHFVTNQKLTVNMLKEISDSKDVWKLLANKVIALEDLIHSTLKHKHAHDYYLWKEQIEIQ